MNRSSANVAEDVTYHAMKSGYRHVGDHEIDTPVVSVCRSWTHLKTWLTSLEPHLQI